MLLFGTEKCYCLALKIEKCLREHSWPHVWRLPCIAGSTGVIVASFFPLTDELHEIVVAYHFQPWHHLTTMENSSCIHEL